MEAFSADNSLLFSPEDGCLFESLRVGKLIGKGAFANVYAAAGIRNGKFEVVAVKVSGALALSLISIAGTIRCLSDAAKACTNRMHVAG